MDELEGSTNQFPFLSLSIRPRLNRLIWHVTPCTFGSATASTTMLLPVQSLRNRPTSSAAAREITARRTRQLTIETRIGELPQTWQGARYPNRYLITLAIALSP